jgi:hypothetical protein
MAESITEGTLKQFSKRMSTQLLRAEKPVPLVQLLTFYYQRLATTSSVMRRLPLSRPTR